MNGNVARSPLTSVSEESIELQGFHFKLEALPRKPNSLFESAASGRCDDIQTYISQRKVKSLDMLDQNGISALHHAVRFNQVKVIDLLVNAGANIDVQSKDGFSPLHLASRSGALEGADSLLNYGANPNLPTKCTGCTPLHTATRFGHRELIARILNEKTTNIDATNSQGMTALQLAVSRGYEDIFRDLLVKGASINTTTTRGQTSLHLAVTNGSTSIVSRVLDAALISLSKSPAKLVISASQLPELSQFVNKEDAEHNCALHIGAQSGNVSLCKLLLQHGADLSVQNKLLQTPLHVASVSKNKEVPEFLISRGADVNAKDSHGKTPLHTAASFGNKECVRIFLSRGASVDARDNRSLTPLLYAVSSEKIDCVKALLDCGADKKASDKQQRCCLHLAVERRNEELLRVLLEKSGTELINFPDACENTPLHFAAISSRTKILEILLEANANCMLKDRDERTPLHLAAEKGDVRIVQTLARASPTSLGAKDLNERTPLHYAALHKRRMACAALVEIESNLEDVDAFGWTPLFFAAKSGATDIMRMFLECNADADHVDKDGNTALIIASSVGHVDGVQLLLDRQVSLVPNKDGDDCLDVAIDQHHENIVMCIVKNSRWKEILSSKSPDSENRMARLIQHFPDAASAVMDRCIQRSLLKRSITYDFHLIDAGPEDKSGPNGQPFFGLTTMVTFKQKELLTHALSKKLLSVKWRTYGWYIYWTNLATYILFVALMTSFMLDQRNMTTLIGSRRKSNETEIEDMFEVQTSFKEMVQYLILLFASLHLVKEVYQIFSQRGKYFKHWTNLLEWALYLSTIIFIVPYIFKNLTLLRGDPRISWQVGIIAVFLGYVDLILFVQTLDHVGIYVTMFLQVTLTIIKAFSLFVMFALAFSVVFYILFKEQDAFRTYPMAIVKVIIMTIGEIDYSAMLVDSLDSDNPITGGPLVPYQQISFFFISIFAFAMPIILMNLLIGLAVGDIESIQKQAYMTHKKRVIDFVSSVENQLPRWITRRLYKTQIVVTGMRAEKKILNETFIMEEDDLGSEDEKNEVGLSLDDLNKELAKAKMRQTSIMESVQEQRNILIRVASKVGVDVDDR